MTYTGYLKVEVSNRFKRSVITNSYFDGVLKITRPSYITENLPLLTLIHVGGGYVDGDSYLTEVMLNESSSLALTTQASTKVYKSPRIGSTQTMNYFLKKDSALFVKQDPLILFRDAKFVQNTNVYMSSSATFSYTDIITPGWSEDMKLFPYERVSSKMKIFVDDSLVVFDHLLLQPSEKLEQLMYLEGFTHIGTMFFFNQSVNASFVDKMREELGNISNIARIGVSLLPSRGVSIRILATSTPVIESIFRDFETYINNRLVNIEKFEWRK